MCTHQLAILVYNYKMINKGAEIKWWNRLNGGIDSKSHNFKFMLCYLLVM